MSLQRTENGGITFQPGESRKNGSRLRCPEIGQSDNEFRNRFQVTQNRLLVEFWRCASLRQTCIELRVGGELVDFRKAERFAP